MTDRFEILREGFRYDLWANLQWLGFLDAKGLDDPERRIFGHLLGAQDVWLHRCHGVSLTAIPQHEPTEDKTRELHEGWIAVLTENEHDPIYEYKSTAGAPYSQRLSRIARHVIDHGTYHRGELRGLCRPRGDEDFPETGLISYYIAMGQTQ